MAIQTRKGPYNKFDSQKLLTGEWATVTEGDPNADDGRAVYMCFLPGIEMCIRDSCMTFRILAPMMPVSMKWS